MTLVQIEAISLLHRLNTDLYEAQQQVYDSPAAEERIVASGLKQYIVDTKTLINQLRIESNMLTPPPSPTL